MDSKLPKNSFLREILYNVQENGKVINAKEILDLAPLSEELIKSGFKPKNIDFDINSIQMEWLTKLSFPMRN